jgi:tetraacyldisaccharide 4'-kinase
VGNITVGGTGKTPHVEMLIRYLAGDYRVAVLSRGYKRSTRGFRMVSENATVAEVGDEPRQVKNHFPDIPVAVDADRVHGVSKLLKIKHKPDVIILDDAYQHRRIKVALSILLVDYTRPVFEDILLPAGNLREPWKNSKRADILIVTKCPPQLTRGERSRFMGKLKPAPRQRVYFTCFSYGKPHPVFDTGQGTLRYKHLRKSGACILLVTGIANPRPFMAFLQDTLVLGDTVLFPDHHTFGKDDLGLVRDRFDRMNGSEKYIFVTAKDAVKIRELEVPEEIRQVLYLIPVHAEFIGKGERSFLDRLHRTVARGKPHRK